MCAHANHTQIQTPHVSMCTVPSHPAPALRSVSVLKTSFCTLQAYHVLGNSLRFMEDKNNAIMSVTDIGVKQGHPINRAMRYFCRKHAEMIVVGLLVSQHFTMSEPLA